MSDRLDDRAPAVRTEAVAAVQRLQVRASAQAASPTHGTAQDPSDPEDKIVSRFLEMMRDDPSGDVRKAVICHVAICKASLAEARLASRSSRPRSS